MCSCIVAILIVICVIVFKRNVKFTVGGKKSSKNKKKIGGKCVCAVFYSSNMHAYMRS